MATERPAIVQHLRLRSPKMLNNDFVARSRHEKRLKVENCWAGERLKGPVAAVKDADLD